MSTNPFAKQIEALPKILRGKQRMVDKKIRRAVADCPVCGGDKTLNMALHPNRRDKSGFHIHAGCTACKFVIME